jgi:flagellar assembly protein FliH
MTLRTRTLARPARFEPQQLVEIRPAALDVHAQQFAEAMDRARAQGLALARAEVDAVMAEHAAATHELRLMTNALSAAIDQLTGRDRDDLSELEEQTVLFGMELAEHLVGRELAKTDEQLAAAVARAMALAPQRGAIVLRFNPLDRALADEAIEAHGELAGRVEVMVDAGVERGGCVAVVGPLQIDAQLGTAMQRVRDVLQP